MEIIHVHNASDGKELFSEDLSGRKKPVLIVRDGETVVFCDVAPAGAEVVAALVRNEDGWSLAAVSAATPVVSGPKSSPEMQLLPGMACAVGGFMFRLEKDETSTECMLLWRYARSKVVADAVVAGRNIVAMTPGEVPHPAVNPPLADEVLFEFFPSVDGIDVVTGQGEGRTRLSLPHSTLFSAGDFEAMYLSAKDATAAMKTSNPFGWPSRTPRRRLLAGMVVLAALFVVAIGFKFRVADLESRLEEPRGAENIEAMADHVEQYEDMADDEALYMMTFLRSLPVILTSKAKPISADLIVRGEAECFSGNTQIARAVQFLKDVIEIQKLAASHRWEELLAFIKTLDSDTFTYFDADSFLNSAFAVCNYTVGSLPQYLARVSTHEHYLQHGPMDHENVDSEMHELLDKIAKDNPFVSDESVACETALFRERARALREYVESRERMMCETNKVTSADMVQLQEEFAYMVDLFQATPYEPIATREREIVLELARSEAKKAIEEGKKDPTGLAISRLAPLGALAEIAGENPETVVAWRKSAKEGLDRLDGLYRSLYQRYRLLVTSDSEGAMKALDEMIAIGATENRFYQWAVREKERINRK